MMVSTFSLDRFHQDTCHWATDLSLVLDVILYTCQAPIILGFVLTGVLLQWIFVPWKLGFGPFQLRNVHSM